MRCLFLFILIATTRIVAAQPIEARPTGGCAELLTTATHSGTTMRYAFGAARGAPVPDARIALVLLVGGGGHVDLDDKGCAQRLNRNSLLRMIPLLRDAGIATVLVDAPSDQQGDDGLGGFRIAAEHARDLGRVIAEVRARTRAAVWIMGHSRGTISAANAAARLAGSSAPDGLVLLSSMMVGNPKAKKSWVAQTVFSADLDAIRMPLLLLGHAADSCVRSPAGMMADVAAKTKGARQQVVTVEGGPGASGRAQGLEVCEVGEPHDFVGQEIEVAAGIVRFMRGGSY